MCATSMPDARQHLKQAQHNKCFLQSISDPKAYADWFVTVCFYQAVHFIDAFLATRRIHPEDHDRRFRELRKLRREFVEFKAVLSHYKDLFDLSQDARYRCTRITEEDMNASSNRHVPAIREWIERKVSPRRF